MYVSEFSQNNNYNFQVKTKQTHTLIPINYINWYSYLSLKFTSLNPLFWLNHIHTPTHQRNILTWYKKNKTKSTKRHQFPNPSHQSTMLCSRHLESTCVFWIIYTISTFCKISRKLLTDSKLNIYFCLLNRDPIPS